MGSQCITPNSGSEKIRQFLPIGYGIETYKLEIYNIHGKLIFESNKLDDLGSPYEPWDGKIDSRDAPQGVYMWKINAKFKNGSVWQGMKDRDGEISNVGTLTLLR